MKPNVPWSVKGIDPEAREAAKMAARRAGMTLGEWLNSLILNGGELPEGFEQAPEELGADVAAAEAASARLDDTARRAGPPESPNALAVSGIDQSIERLASTIESSRRMLADTEGDTKRALTEMAKRMEVMEKRLGGPQTDGGRSGPGVDPRTLQALERAISGVATHIEKSDRRNAELVASVENALGELSARVGGVEESASDAIGRLELAFDRLSGRIDQVEGEQRRSAARLSERVTALDDRVGDLADRGTGASPELTDRLAAMGRRLDRTESDLGRAIGSASAAALDKVGRDDLRKLESRLEVAERGARDAARESTSQGLAELDARFTGLSDRLDRLFGLLEQRTDESAVAAQSANAAFDARIAEMAEKLSEIEAGNDEHKARFQEAVDDLSAQAEKNRHDATAALAAMKDIVEQLSRRGGQARKAESEGAVPLGAGEAKLVSPIYEDGLPEDTMPPLVEEPAPTAASSWRWRAGEADETSDESAEEILEAESLEASEREPGAAGEDEITYLEDLELEGEETDAGGEAWRERVFGRVRRDLGAQEEEDREPDVAEEGWEGERQRETAGDALDEVEEIDESDLDSDHEEITQEGVGFDETVEAEEREEDRRGAIAGFDWSSLARDIGSRTDVEEPTGEAEEHPETVSGLEDLTENLEVIEEEPKGTFGRRVAKDAREPAPMDVEGDEDELVPADDYLAQARRAARSAGEKDRSAHLLIGDEEERERSGLPWWITVPIALVVLMLVALIVWFVVLPMVSGPDTVSPASKSAPQSAETEETRDAEMAPLAGAEGEDLSAEAPPGDASTLAEARGAEEATPGEADQEEAIVSASEDAQTLADAAETEPEVPPTPQEALRATAEAGDAKAQYALALAYQSGQGEVQDADLSVEWMRKAADQELAVAQFALGYILEKGSGIAANEGEARRLYEKSARGGNMKAMHNLAMFHVDGKGGLQPSGVEAERWFRQAAEFGLVDSQMNLAILYHQGDRFGLGQALADAYFWYSVAGLRGDSQARDYAAELGETLAAEEKTEVDARVAEWTPKRPDLIANGGFDTSAESFLPPEQRTPLTRTELTRIQEALNALGFDAGPADGRPGAKTEQAIGAFQEAYGLPVNGRADRDLLTALGVVPR